VWLHPPSFYLVFFVILRVIFTKVIMVNKKMSRRRAPRSQNRMDSVPRLLNGEDKSIHLWRKHYITYGNGSSAINSTNLNPNNFGTALAALAGVYQEFRFHKIVIKIHAVGTSSPNPIIVGYFKTLPTTAPTTQTDIYQGEATRLITGPDTIPQMLVLDPKLIKNNVRPWFTSRLTGLSDLLDGVQGILYVAFSATTPITSVTLEFGFHIELRGMTAPAVA